MKSSSIVVVVATGVLALVGCAVDSGGATEEAQAGGQIQTLGGAVSGPGIMLGEGTTCDVGSPCGTYTQKVASTIGGCQGTEYTCPETWEISDGKCLCYLDIKNCSTKHYNDCFKAPTVPGPIAIK